MATTSTIVTPHPAWQFVDHVQEAWVDSGVGDSAQSAFRLSGWTVVVARGITGRRLEDFVEVDLGGRIQRPGEEAGA